MWSGQFAPRRPAEPVVTVEAASASFDRFGDPAPSLARTLRGAAPPESQQGGPEEAGPSRPLRDISWNDGATPGSSGGRPGSSDAPIPGGPRRLSDVLPEEEWYRLWLAAEDHEEALARFPDDPGSLYDHQLSPGYQASMMRAFREALDPPDRVYPRLDADGYKHLHELVISNLGRNIGWSGRSAGLGKIIRTNFDLLTPLVSEDLLAERVDGRPVTAWLDGPAAGGRPITVLVAGTRVPRLWTSYRASDAPGLVQAALDRYYEEAGAAQDADGRLRAITRAVRNLHMMHLFEDANLRLNGNLLLSRLLLEQGFSPVVHPELAIMFSGGRSLDEIVAALRDGQPNVGSAAGPAAGEQQATVFSPLPAEAVAVNTNGTYMTVPSGVGVLADMDNPRFFDADGRTIGDVLLPGVRDGEDEVSFDVIRKRIREGTSLPKVSYLVLWYLAAHTAAPRLTVNYVQSARLEGILNELGMTWTDIHVDMTGDTRTVERLARAAAEREGWTLRDPWLVNLAPAAGVAQR